MCCSVEIAVVADYVIMQQNPILFVGTCSEFLLQSD